MKAVFASLILLLSVFFPVGALASEDEARTSKEDYLEARREIIEKRREITEELRKKRQEITKEIRTKREEFREKLATVRDDRKRLILERLDERIDAVNEKWVEHWNSTLTRLSEFLVKIEERTGGGADTSGAEAAIAKAQTAVDAQAEKTYGIEIGEEETLGENAKALLAEFHGDLREVHALVKNAREEVVKVLRNVKANEEGGTDEEEE